MHHDVRQMRHPRAHHLQTGAERKERGVLTHHEQVQGVAPLHRLLHQMAVAEGERIGVHHYRANVLPALALRAQGTAVAFDPLRGVLHQHRVVPALGNRPEAAAGKALPVARTGAEEEVKMAALQRRIFHLCQQPRAEVLAAKLLVDRHAFDDVGSKPSATHQLRAGPGFDEQRDVVVQAKAAVCQQVADLA